VSPADRGGAHEDRAVVYRLRFTGEQRDGESDLYYLRVRYHDPSTGRFLTQDGFPGSSVAPRSLHRYVYAENTPRGCGRNVVDAT